MAPRRKTMTAPEPSFFWQNLAIWVVPYAAYFVGIWIRKAALPGVNSPPLTHQLLLGVPVGLVVVSPFVAVLRVAMSADVTAYLFNIGIVIEHGMLLQETATLHLKKLVGKGMSNREDRKHG